MIKQIVRTLCLIGLTIAVLLFGLMMWAEFGGGGAWMTGIIVAFVVDILFLTGLFFVPTGTAAPERRVRFDYPGDVHDVVDLEGIGPAYAKKLHADGIIHTQDLLLANTDALARVTGAPAKTVGRWQAMAELVKVNGIGPQYAEVLARVGISGIDELKTCTPKALTDRMNTYLDGLKSTVIGRRAGTKTVGKWIQTARKMEKTPVNSETLKVQGLQSKAARRGAKHATA